ncbi:MAG: hypothetical protein WCJ14_08715 [Verrucomicrobiota bacterium]
MTRAIASIVLITAAVLGTLIWMQGGDNLTPTRHADSSIRTRSTTRGDSKPPPGFRKASGLSSDTDAPRSSQPASNAGSNNPPASTASNPALANDAAAHPVEGESTAGSVIGLAARNGQRPPDSHAPSSNAALADPPSAYPAANEPATGSPANPTAPGNSNPQAVVIPTALQAIPAVGVVLSDYQRQAIDQTAGQFVELVGGENQDPASPAYLASWQQAQPLADTLLKARIGWQAYDGIQVIAARKANEQVLSGQAP